MSEKIKRYVMEHVRIVEQTEVSGIIRKKLILDGMEEQGIGRTEVEIGEGDNLSESAQRIVLLHLRRIIGVDEERQDNNTLMYQWFDCIVNNILF